MSLARYLKYRIPELIFCALASSALAFTACSAFYASQPFQAAPWAIALACTLLTLVFSCIAFSPKSRIAGSIAVAVALVAVLSACVAASPGQSPVDDVEGNLLFVVLMVFLPTLLVFLLSRTKLLSVVLLVVGVLICALIEYLYWYGHVVALVLFIIGAVGLIVLKGYQQNLAGSDTDKLAFGSAAAAAVALSLVGLLAGGGIYLAVVAPLDPPNQVIKLFVEHRRADEVEIMGTAASPESSAGDEGNLGNDQQEDSSSTANDFMTDVVKNSIMPLLGMDADKEGDDGATTAIVTRIAWVVLIVLVIVLLAVAAVLIKRALRQRRFNRMVAGGNTQAVRNLYPFFFSRLARIGIVRPDTVSLSSFAASRDDALAVFEQGGVSGRAASVAAPDASTQGASTPGSGPLAAGQHKSAFAGLTDTYERVVYGLDEATEQEGEAAKAYYRSLYANLRAYMGTPKYLLKYFSL